MQSEELNHKNTSIWINGAHHPYQGSVFLFLIGCFYFEIGAFERKAPRPVCCRLHSSNEYSSVSRMMTPTFHQHDLHF